MKLYHGSTVVIDKIDLSVSKPNKDFGKGFYLSDNEQQAYEMASYKAAQLDMEPVADINRQLFTSQYKTFRQLL